MTPEEVRQSYAAIEPELVALEEDLTTQLRAACRKARAYDPRISSRLKTLPSILLKAYRRGFADPLAELKDKVGVRADLVYQHEADAVVEALREQLDGYAIVEEKRLGDDLVKKETFGYAGVHFTVVPTETTIDPKWVRCEIQVRTNAQAAWAMASHQLAYKPAVGRTELEQREVKRLAVLMELFDDQVAQSYRRMTGSEGYAVNILLAALEAERFKFNAHPFDRQLTRLVLEELVGEMTAEEAHAKVDEIKKYVSNNEVRVKELMTSDWPVTLAQPETIFVAMRLTQAKASLLRDWENSGLDMRILTDIANRLAIRLPRPH